MGFLRWGLACVSTCMLFFVISLAPALSKQDQSFEFAEVKIGASDAFMVTNDQTQSAAERALAASAKIKELLLDVTPKPSNLTVKLLSNFRVEFQRPI